MRTLWLPFLALLSLITGLSGQIRVELGRPSISYMQYESIIMDVRITNMSSEPLDLGNVEGKSWLRFSVKRGSGSSVRPTQEFTQPPVHLEPGDTARFGFNLLPFYAIREIDNYTVTALVRMPTLSGDLISNAVQFSVVNGITLWSREIVLPEESDKRLFSLLSFYRNDQNQIYAQVESEPQNLVYLCMPLGTVLAGERPRTEFDPSLDWHILYRAAPDTYRYFKFTSKGRLLQQETLAGGGSRPTLIPDASGTWALVGGVDPKTQQGERLSETQPTNVMTPGAASEAGPEKKKTPSPTLLQPGATTSTPAMPPPPTQKPPVPPTTTPPRATPVMERPVSGQIQHQTPPAPLPEPPPQPQAKPKKEKKATRTPPSEEPQPREKTSELAPPDNLLRRDLR
jgi:hypothetical protein